MPKTNTCNSNKEADLKNEPLHFTKATFEPVRWSFKSSCSLDDKIIAIQTTRIVDKEIVKPHLNKNSSSARAIKNEDSASDKSSFDSFNLGLHVGDCSEQVIANRQQLKQFISQKLLTKPVTSHTNIPEEVKIQWLEQVHGNKVVIVTSVDEQAIIADASITREKNIALAIMTADCLPILLSHIDGLEIAAIHGGWRSLAASIITKTLENMHSKPSDVVAWLGPCIGKNVFEVGSEVKQAFTQIDTAFSDAFVSTSNGKYLADLHHIARLQLESLGIKVISSLNECTYERTDKYYSYRKEHSTGRMATIICKR